MNFGYDLLANPQKVKPYRNPKDIAMLPDNVDIDKNIELLGKESRPDLLIDIIEDDIVEHIPHIHTKIDNQTLREIIHLSVKNYQKIENRKKLDITSKSSNMNNKIFTPTIKKPKLEKPKFININHNNNDFGLKKIH